MPPLHKYPFRYRLFSISLMKQLILLVFTFAITDSYGQTHTDSSGIDLFDQGLDHYNKKNFDSAIIIWTKIVDQKIGLRYDVYGNAFFNIPRVYWQMKKYEKAKEWYKKILNSELRDNNETGSLMEPHTNYKHKSAVALASLYQIDSNYLEVLQWLDKADTVYRYWGFEGSATNISQKKANLLNWKVDVLLKLNKKEDAIQAIIIELIFSRSLENFFRESEDTLLTIIDKSNFRSDFDKALNQMTIQAVDTSNWIATFVFQGIIYRIPISKIHPDMSLPHYWRIYFISKSEDAEKNSFIEYIKGRRFYKRLTN
jgi:tetratricopeptide (TPR) repeat protein